MKHARWWLGVLAWMVVLPARADGAFDYYVLALSWSPVYCESHPGDRVQCGSTRYGLVLHGLWPQLADGRHPARCATSQRLDESARRVGATIYPSPRLVAHEWETHGTCSGLAPLDYFRTADDARTRIRVPALLEPGSQTVSTTAATVSSALRDANPGLTNRSVVLTCAGRELAEVRICLDRRLVSRTCGTGVRMACPSGPIEIPGAR